MIRAALKEKNMKRIFPLWLGLPAAAGLLAFALVPAFAQQPASTMGKIHGQVINPTGAPQTNGTVNLSTDGGATFKYTFPVSADGEFSGEVAPGTYALIYREPNTPKGQMVDEIKGVKVAAGADVDQDIDMSRPAYLAKMTPEQRKQLEELKKQNSQALKANAVIKQLNADLKVVTADQQDIDNAVADATKSLGSGASKAQIESKAEQIKTAKYNDILSLMTKDTGVKPDEPVLWVKLGYAQAGLKKYDDAITSYQKAISLESAQKTPQAAVLGVANAGLGEVYARTGKVAEANAAYDASAKADPTKAGLELRNEAIIFFQQGNADAQVAAAEEALKIDPNDALLYYLKGQGLVQKATIDPTTHKIVLPPGCAEAYQKYLQLAPKGQFAPEVAGILQQAGKS
jgi:tetratricopeptide (TPR) repeat protein